MVGTTTKKRDITFLSGTARSTGSGGAVSTYPISIVGSQTTVSTDSLWPTAQRLLRNPHVDDWDKQRLRNLDLGTGGFQTRKNTYEDFHYPHSIFAKTFPSTTFSYVGPSFAKSYNVGPASSLWPTLSFPDWSTLVTAGTAAIARTVPNNPVAGLLRSLGELREGIPHVPLKALRHGFKGAKQINAGDEFLNVVFGWLPSVKDAIDVTNAVKNSKEILEEFIQQAGKNIFRRYVFPEVTTTTLLGWNTQATTLPVGPTQLYGTNGYLGRAFAVRQQTKRIWFEGVYTYYADMGKTQFERMKYSWDLADKVLGVELTPDTVYQLTGWTWLAEWAWNMGDVMKNLSAFSKDGLVMRRGYVMMHDIIRDTYVLDGIVDVTNGSHPPVYQTFGTESKVRMKATPYGFGFDWNGITPMQSAILAALGISRFGR